MKLYLNIKGYIILKVLLYMYTTWKKKKRKRKEKKKKKEKNEEKKLNERKITSYKS